MTDGFDRRSVLRGIAAGVVAGSTTGLAGCGGLPINPGGPGGSSADASYLFEPGTVADGDHYTVRFADPATVAEFDGDLSDETVASIEDRAAWLYEATDTDFDEASSQLTFRTVAVVAVDHDEEAVADELDDDDFDEDSEDENGYRVFVSAEERFAVAFDGSVVIGAQPTSGESDPVNIVEEVIDAEAGDADRYADESEAFAGLLDELDGDVFVGGAHEATDETDAEGGRFEGEVARGLTASLDEDTTDVRLVLAFDDEDDVATDDVEEWTGADAFEDWDDVSVDAGGAVVTVSATLDTDAFAPSIPATRSADVPLDWIPSPDALGIDQGFDVQRAAPTALSNVENLSDQFAERFADGGLSSELSLESPPLERITAGRMQVVRTELDDEEIANRLTDAGYESAEDYGGFAFYQRPNGVTAVAVDSGTVLSGRRWEDVAPRAVVETMIDAVGGDAALYVEADEDLAAVASRIEVRPAVSYRPNPGSFFNGAQATGISYEFGDEQTSLTIPWVFEDADSIPEDDVEDQYSRVLDDIELQRDGRVVVVTGTIATSELN